MRETTCWIVTEGSIGMENQCRGLAEALALRPAMKRVDPRLPWLLLPADCWPWPFLSLGRGSDRLRPPWPDILITCGRKGVPFALAIKRASGGRTFAIHIQDPLIDPAKLDLVAVPSHDRIRGPNVIVTRGAIHPVTPAKLAAAAAHFRPAFAALPRPLVAVLIGGPNGRYRLEPADMTAIAERLAALARGTGAGLCVTTSRRTGRENERVLRERLAGVPAVIWTGEGENPYLGMLALADHVLVTADSVSMVTEACATGKPVYIIELAGGSRRFRLFHDEMRAAGMTRPFAGRLESASYEPCFEAERVAAEVRRRLAQREAAKVAASGA
ncbi:MAG TPA: mitochondrial fission ELM1 family protein [Alphaproteobacteria bacterium]|nr:mitochondrial fission ELM1 family protein [Alphaproteobacteria bacterium]